MRFSVIIPVYNVAPYLRACLDSVCAAVQELECRVGVGERTDHPSVEVICVDDGSTDGSGEILDEYASRQSNNQTIPNQTIPNQTIFRVLHQENRGVSAARNAGLAVTTGDWIGFADADDLLAPTALADAKTLIGRHPDADLVALGKSDFFENASLDFGAEAPLAERTCERKDGLALAVAMTSFVQMFIRRDICANLRFPGYRMGEDRVFVHRVIRRVRKAILSDKVGYCYRIHGASACHSRMTLRKRWDDFRHAVHVLTILLATPQAGWRMRLRYVRAAAEKILGVMGF